MKAESNIRPEQPFVVDIRGEVADITFYRNPVKLQREEEVVWEYDTYTLTTTARPELVDLVTENYDAWLSAAIAYEAAEKPPAEPSLEERVAQHEEKIVSLEDVVLEILMF